MDDRDWTSERSVDSDALSPLPPLVIWTSRRSTACPPWPDTQHLGTPYTAHHHVDAVGGNQVETTEASFVYYAIQHISFSPCNIPSVTTNLPPCYPPPDLTYKFMDPRPECQRKKDTNPTELSATAVENPCSIPMTSAMDIEQRSQNSGNQTVNYPISVSDHYTGHGQVEYYSKCGDYSNTSPVLDLHSIGQVLVSPQALSVSEVAKHHDCQTLDNQHTSELCSETDSQHLDDFYPHHSSLSEEPGVSRDRQHDMCDREHAHSGEDPHKCKHCDQSFSTQSRLTSHERTHPEEKSFKCEVCDNTFNYRSHLVCHGRVHSGEKPFTCKYCPRSFSTRFSLTRHEFVHNGEKPFKCDHCDQSFCDRSSLKSHKHTHTGEKPFQCKECNKAFRRQTHLRDHQRIHTGVKPFKCKICGNSFSWKSNLTVHERIHP
ncbi:zinc finger protein 724-like [Sycon ciliatum]|uniref:zinc finger protein 724-like n=1 Tax=Sycon ciliatum TaxID=27933 RepID=UPI0031F70815